MSEADKPDEKLHDNIVHQLRMRGWERLDAIDRADELVAKMEQRRKDASHPAYSLDGGKDE